jgi:phage shock protein PspC (stress-responsive transcriptional regulator)
MTSASAPRYENSLDGARAWFAHNRLTRPHADRVVAGVTAGIARRYDINPLVARVAMVAAAIALTPLLYVALWVLMPSDDPIQLDG